MFRRLTKFLSLICSIFILTSIGGVFATWKFAITPPADANADLEIGMYEFNFILPMPDYERMFLERILKVLNLEYECEGIDDVRKYLLEETIRVEWEDGSAPYVGSMDPDYETQINKLFGDIIRYHDVSFILKNQDLNFDGFNEIACYSTSDPLDCVEQNYNGIVGVYLTVFTPVIDEQKNIIGYEMVCDSIHGFCNEVHYNPDNPTISSFSTDDWRDNVVYWHHIYDTQPMPDDAFGIDGVTSFKYHYESYHPRCF